MESPIKSAQDLANQDQVKYGCMRDGATADFFRVIIVFRFSFNFLQACVLQLFSFCSERSRIHQHGDKSAENESFKKIRKIFSVNAR